MILEHIGLSQINGSLVVLDGVKGVQYDEMAELHLDDGSTRVGRVVRVDGDRCVIQVFEGTRGLSLVNNRTVLTGHPMMMDLSPELLGRVLDGLGRPIDGLGDIYPVARRDVNGAPINPVSRVSVFGFMNPVFGVALSALLLGEGAGTSPVTVLVALLLVCGGIIIVNRPKKV